MYKIYGILITTNHLIQIALGISLSILLGLLMLEIATHYNFYGAYIPLLIGLLYMLVDPYNVGYIPNLLKLACKVLSMQKLAREEVTILTVLSILFIQHILGY